MKNVPLLLVLGSILLTHLFILKNITFTAWPEMFSYPYLVNNDYLIYKDFAHPYVPLLTFLLSFYYQAVGMNLQTHQFFTWGLILVNDFLIFFISYKLLKKVFAFIPLLIYVFLQPIFEGNMLWFDIATTPFILGFFAASLYIKEINRRLFWMGFLIATAILIKQQAVILVFLLSLTILFLKETTKSIYFYILGFSIPIFFVFLILVTFNIFSDYIFWTLEFPLIWLPKFSGYSQMPRKRDIFFLTVLFVFPVMFLISKYLRINTFAKFILVSISATTLMAFPRFSYFHLQPALAVLIIFYAVLLKDFKKIAHIFLLIAVFTGVFLWKDYRPFNGVTQSRFYDDDEIKLTKFIDENTTDEDKLYLMGPHSLLYSLSGTLPPHPWIENYVWHFEIPGLQERQIEGFNREKNLVIFKQGFASGNWYDLGVYKPLKILNYIDRNFEQVNRSEDGIEVWKRKKD